MANEIKTETVRGLTLIPRDGGFSDEQLQQIAANGALLEPYLRPSVCANCSAKVQEFCENTGRPSFGGVTNLRVERDGLIGDVQDCPDFLAAVLRRGSFGEVRAALYDADRSPEGLPESQFCFHHCKGSSNVLCNEEIRRLDERAGPGRRRQFRRI